jgi:hypothetical protein
LPEQGISVKQNIMKTPFSTEEFFSVFGRYNTLFFPSQILILILAIVLLVLLHNRSKSRHLFAGTFLGVLWIWNGAAYHIALFSEINSIAKIFGALFILQGALIILNSFGKREIHFDLNKGIRGYTAYFLAIFGLIIYPAIGYITGDDIIRTISLGLPCPSTIFTFGIFMFASNRLPRYLLIIPSVWAVIGLSAAINFGVVQDFMLIIAAVSANIFLLKKNNGHFMRMNK